ncbi:hypothetical protein ACGFYF_05925 [Streptomyces lavendulae]|uniref:hypothetical protein n=1 Tax=Streptomyces lavendulae TaxID=1914 RepID=UPI00371B48AC
MPSTDRPTGRLLTAVAVMCASLLCGGCGESRPEHGADAAGSVPAAKAAPASPAAPGTSVEEIAGALGCTAEMSVEADELRQGACETAQGAYRVTTFTADQGLRSWLAETRTYGGVYLVGDRWVVTGPSAQALTALHDRLGGTIETGTSHEGHSPSAADPSASDPSASDPSAAGPSGAEHSPSAHGH